jgi:hypothetical protein
MLISDPLISALIAGAVSVAISIISYISVMLKSRSEKESLKRTLSRQLTGRLYELRLKHYPEAFTITDKLGKRTGHNEEELPQLFRNLFAELSKWKVGEPSLIMSADSLEAYYSLQHVLKRNPALGSKYNEEQLARIWKVRMAFRNQLRADVGLLFEEEGDVRTNYDRFRLRWHERPRNRNKSTPP